MQNRSYVTTQTHESQINYGIGKPREGRKLIQVTHGNIQHLFSARADLLAVRGCYIARAGDYGISFDCEMSIDDFLMLSIDSDRGQLKPSKMVVVNPRASNWLWKYDRNRYETVGCEEVRSWYLKNIECWCVDSMGSAIQYVKTQKRMSPSAKWEDATRTFHGGLAAFSI